MWYVCIAIGMKSITRHTILINNSICDVGQTTAGYWYMYTWRYPFVHYIDRYSY